MRNWLLIGPIKTNLGPDCSFHHIPDCSSSSCQDDPLSSQTRTPDFVDRGHLDRKNDILGRQVLNKSWSCYEGRYSEHPSFYQDDLMSSYFTLSSKYTCLKEVILILELNSRHWLISHYQNINWAWLYCNSTCFCIKKIGLVSNIAPQTVNSNSYL